MDVSDTSSTLTSSDLDDHDRHNVWNPLLHLLCRVHTGVCMEHYSTKKIREELNFLVILHWTFFATKNKSAFAKKDTSLVDVTGTGMTKRERQDSITIDYTKSQEVAGQGSTSGVDQSSHVDYVCDFPPSDLVIDSGIKFDIDNVVRDPGQSRFPNCSAHVMVANSSRPFRPLRPFPRSVFQADTIIVSCGLANLKLPPGRSIAVTKFGVYGRN